MPRLVWASLAITAGCGRIAFDPLGTDDGDAGDGGADAAPGCAPWTAATRFTPPVRIVELASTDPEQQPHLTRDGLTIYFASSRGGGGFDIYTAQRGAIGQPFTNVHAVTELNSGADETAFTPAASDLYGYMSTARGGMEDIYVSQRGAIDQPWGTPVRFAGSSSTVIDYDPFESADGLRLYWALEDSPAGAGATDLVVATRATPAGTYGASQFLVDINTAAIEDNPSETADGRMLVFASDRGANKDIYFATRASTSDPFAAVTRVPDVNDASTDSEPWVTPDGCELWFNSDRAGDQDVYFADVIR